MKRLDINKTPDIVLSMKWYRKIPVKIEAVRLNCPFRVTTPEGVVRGKAGDWLIRGVEGELYPCRDSVFQKTYKQVFAKKKRRSK